MKMDRVCEGTQCPEVGEVSRRLPVGVRTSLPGQPSSFLEPLIRFWDEMQRTRPTLIRDFSIPGNGDLLESAFVFEPDQCQIYVDVRSGLGGELKVNATERGALLEVYTRDEAHALGGASAVGSRRVTREYALPFPVSRPRVQAFLLGNGVLFLNLPWLERLR